MGEPKIRLSELKRYGWDEDKFLCFLYDLEKAGLLRSQLEVSIDGLRMERVWYAV
jgi:hypothetical protein